MSSDVHCLLDQTVNVLRNLGGASFVIMISTILLQQSDDLLTGQELDTGDSFSVSDGDTDLRR